MKLFTPFLAILFTLTSTSLATAEHTGGGMDSGGVDAVAARRVQIQNILQGMQGDIASYLGTLNPATLTIAGAKEIRELIQRGLLADVKASTYVLREECLNSAGQVVWASTLIGVRGAEVCVNLAKISNQPVIPAEVYSLILHEHAHHLGENSTPQGEQRASELGNAMGPQVAAYRFFHPRPDQIDGVNPVVERPSGKCLNVGSLAEQWKTKGGVGTAFTQDIDVTAKIPGTKLDLWTAAGLSDGPHILTTPVEIFFGRRKFYQTGCESVFQEKASGVYERLAITASGPTFIEVNLPTATTGHLVKSKVTAAQGIHSQEIVQETTSTEKLTLNCQKVAKKNSQKIATLEITKVLRDVLIHSTTGAPASSQLFGVSKRALSVMGAAARTRVELRSGILRTSDGAVSDEYKSCWVTSEIL